MICQKIVAVNVKNVNDGCIFITSHMQPGAIDVRLYMSLCHLPLQPDDKNNKKTANHIYGLSRLCYSLVNVYMMHLCCIKHLLSRNTVILGKGA